MYLLASASTLATMYTPLECVGVTKSGAWGTADGVSAQRPDEVFCVREELLPDETQLHITREHARLAWSRGWFTHRRSAYTAQSHGITRVIVEGNEWETPTNLPLQEEAQYPLQLKDVWRNTADTVHPRDLLAAPGSTAYFRTDGIGPWRGSWRLDGSWEGLREPLGQFSIPVKSEGNMLSAWLTAEQRAACEQHGYPIGGDPIVVRAAQLAGPSRGLTG